MRFTAEKPALDAALSFIAPFAIGNAIPIITTIKIEASDRVSLSATDLDSHICRTIGASVLKPGTVCVDAALLRGIVNSAPDGAQIEFELHNERVKIRSGRVSATLGTLDHNDFPIRDLSKSFTHSFAIDPGQLRALFSRVSFAVGSDVRKHWLCGVHLSSRDGNLMAQATDGHVLSRVLLAADLGTGMTTQPIIPSAAVQFALKLAASSGPITVRTGEFLIGFDADDLVFSSKIIDGQFPDADRVIPKTSGDPIFLDKSAALQSLTRFARLVEKSNDKQREVRIEFSGQSASIEGALPTGDFSDSFDCTWSGDPIKECFNVTELAQAINSFDGDVIEFHGNRGGKPWLLRQAGSTDGSLVVVTTRFS